MALGVRKNTPVEGIQGDPGWSSFAAREAAAKLSYEDWLLRLPDTNLAYQTLVHIIFEGVSTRWTRRTANLLRRFGVPPASIAYAAAEPASTMGVVIRAQVQKAGDREVTQRSKREARSGPAKKTTLWTVARHGVLGARVWRVKFTSGLDAACAICGTAEVTVSHICSSNAGIHICLRVSDAVSCLG